METLGNINLDVLKQGAEIEELKLVILSQQVQISKLKKMVLRLVHKKRRKQYVLKKRGDVNDAFKKGENPDEKQSPGKMKFQFEGETDFEGEIGAKTDKEAETDQVKESEAEMAESAAVTEKVATETGLSMEELEIAETLVKAKNDTPKATQKAKGVEIKEELDEEIAKKLQAELRQEEESQTAKDRQITLDMSTKLNEEYQKSLRAAAEAKKVHVKASMPRQPAQTKKRQSS
ncbi:hypothetical protein L6452_06645 [Arctium lappa]|uniref:Uncharacterized protein n=1 Tax=Arctium lappa TaxID=4217 RepID=A0ACB9EKT1_ARCLA|nr:hypothetical protein L6452_06645 [Arctium lappa]